MSIITDEAIVSFCDNIYKYFIQNVYDISDITKDQIHLCTNIKEDAILFGYNPTDEYSGAVLLPNETIDIINILLEYTEDIAKNVLITMHEFVHAYDFIRFAKYYCNGDYLQITNHPLYATYELWSEFHAFAVGKISFIEYSNSQINKELYVAQLDTEVQKHINHVYELIDEGSFGLYPLMNLLSIFYVYDYFYPVATIEESLFYQHMGALFSPEDRDRINFLYQKSYLSVSENQIFDLLEELQKLYQV